MLMTVMLGDGGSSTPESGPSSMTVEVDADRLYATAHELEATANRLVNWITANDDRFAVRPAGIDVISTGVAGFFHETWSGSQGAKAQVRDAAANLFEMANTMRAAAKSYHLADTTNAVDLGSAT